MVITLQTHHRTFKKAALNSKLTSGKWRMKNKSAWDRLFWHLNKKKNYNKIYVPSWWEGVKYQKKFYSWSSSFSWVHLDCLTPLQLSRIETVAAERIIVRLHGGPLRTPYVPALSPVLLLDMSPPMSAELSYVLQHLSIVSPVQLVFLISSSNNSVCWTTLPVSIKAIWKDPTVKKNTQWREVEGAMWWASAPTGGGGLASLILEQPPPAVLKITSSLSIWLTRQTGALGEYYLTGVCSTARQTDSHTHTCKHTHTYTHTNISLSNY